MLSLADKSGEVGASVPGLARVANVSLAECEQALQCFLSPDAYSRTKDNEGRRIAVIDGGWRLLNHGKYRAKLDVEDRKARQAQWVAQKRASTAVVSTEMSTAASTSVDKSNESTHTDTDTDTNTKKDQKNGSRAKALSLTGWLKSIGEDEAIPADHSVFTFASKVGIPREFLDLAWEWMLDTYGADGLRKAKRYADWPAVFRNAVEGNWPKIWWIDSDGQYRLTTVGEQRKRAA